MTKFETRCLIALKCVTFFQCGKLLARRLADPEAAKATRNDGKMDYINVATTVFTPIEYGACGYSEEDATDTFGADNIEVFHTNFWPLEWTLAKRPENASYCKLVCNKNDKVCTLARFLKLSGFFWYTFFSDVLMLTFFFVILNLDFVI